ncbi:MAG: hypothetical protein OD814_000092 [Candidatus Alkanophagales archaeon MCA70_species_1]|nr:hypothetical protein [Candidatus Alkanophaga volatiphilum]
MNREACLTMSRRDVHQPIRTADFAPHRAGKLAKPLQPTRTNAFNIINNFRQFLPWLNHGLPWRWGCELPFASQGAAWGVWSSPARRRSRRHYPLSSRLTGYFNQPLRLPSLTAVTSLHHTTSKYLTYHPLPCIPIMGSCKQRDDKERFGEVD